MLADPNKKIVAYQQASDDLLERSKKISEVCQKYGIPLKGAALKFSLKDQRIDSTIIGPVTPEQLYENITLMDTAIPLDLWRELDQYAIYDQDPERNRF